MIFGGAPLLTINRKLISSGWIFGSALPIYWTHSQSWSLPSIVGGFGFCARGQLLYLAAPFGLHSIHPPPRSFSVPLPAATVAFFSVTFPFLSMAQGHLLQLKCARKMLSESVCCSSFPLLPSNSSSSAVAPTELWIPDTGL